MLVTESAELAHRVKIMRLHGHRPRRVGPLYPGPAPVEVRCRGAGVQVQPDDLASAIGRVQLDGQGAIVQAHRHCPPIPGGPSAACRSVDAIGRREPRLAPFHRAPPRGGAHNRQGPLHGGAVRARDRGVSPLHFASPDELLPRPLRALTRDFPAARDASLRCMSLPLSASLSDVDAERVITAVTEIGRASSDRGAAAVLSPSAVRRRAAPRLSRQLLRSFSSSSICRRCPGPRSLS